MFRSHLRALALPAVVAGAGALAAGAAPAHAATSFHDLSFGSAGFALGTFTGDELVTAPMTIIGPNGAVVTAALTERLSTEPVAGETNATYGLTVTQRTSTGAPAFTTFFDRIQDDRGGVIHDMRFRADGAIVVAGSGGKLDRKGVHHFGWTAIVEPGGLAGATRRIDPRNGICATGGETPDAGILPDGHVAFAWSCGKITINDPDLAGAPAEPMLDRVADLVDVDAAGRIVWFRHEGPGADRLGRLGRSDVGFVPDLSFGTGGVADAPFHASHLDTDASSRPVVAQGTGGIRVARTEADGDPDPSFGTAGLTTYSDPRATGVTALGTDAANRVLLALRLQGPRADGIVRLLAGGAPDPAFGAGGMQVLDQARTIDNAGAPVADGDAVYGTFGFQPDGFETYAPQSGVTSIPAAEGAPVVAVLRFIPPAPEPPVKPPTDDPDDKPAGPSTTVASSTAPGAITAAASRTTPKPRTLRTCLSRRSFTIRVRPANRKLRSAVVTVAGKKAKVKRVNGRLTATVNLTKLKSASFRVKVVAKDAKGRTFRETRRYRTCRKGKNGPKVKGGRTIITVGA